MSVTTERYAEGQKIRVWPSVALSLSVVALQLSRKDVVEEFAFESHLHHLEGRPCFVACSAQLSPAQPDRVELW